MKNKLGIFIKIIIGCFLFAGLPVIGWGIFDSTGFISHPIRLAYIVIAVLMQIIIVIIEPEIGRQGNIGKTMVNRQKMAIPFLQIVSLAIILLAPFCDRRNIAAFSSFEIGRYVGLGIFIIGFMIMNWAEICLGKLFSIQVTIQNDHQLVTNGLFKYVRNPRYLGILLNNIGIAFIFRSWLAIVLVLFLIAVLIWRIRDEEELMKKEFGRSWEEYKKRTWRLLPFIH